MMLSGRWWAVVPNAVTMRYVVGGVLRETVDAAAGGTMTVKASGFKTKRLKLVDEGPTANPRPKRLKLVDEGLKPAERS